MSEVGDDAGFQAAADFRNADSKDKEDLGLDLSRRQVMLAGDGECGPKPGRARRQLELPGTRRSPNAPTGGILGGPQCPRTRKFEQG